jgi:two-component system nitrogen regulation response regulator NtrX
MSTDHAQTPNAPTAYEIDHGSLYKAMTVARKEMLRTGRPLEALHASFEHFLRGLRGQVGLLLGVKTSDPLELEILYAKAMSPAQMDACVRGESVEGVSPSVIREAIKKRSTVFIPNSQDVPERERTSSLEGDAYSVLCAPIIDSSTESVVAVVYLQNRGVMEAFGDADEAILGVYATGIGWGFGEHLNTRRVQERLESERDRFMRQQRGGAPEIIGESVATKELVRVLEDHLIPSTTRQAPKPILILGDPGTGKEVVARYIHYYSPTRARGPFVAYNCSQLRGDLATSILFGHVKGSFSGAIADSQGLFRSAHKGVLLLDEVGEMPLEGQALLLRVLQMFTVQPLGSAREEAVDVQVVLATNRDLTKDVEEGRFRRDLYSRIEGLPVRLLALGSPARRADIRPLIGYFLAKHEKEMQKKTGGLQQEAMQAMMNYAWPDNVREVDNACSALVTYAAAGAKIGLVDIQNRWPKIIRGPQHPDAAVYIAEDATFNEAREIWTREFLRDRIERCGGNLTQAARTLGMSEATFARYRERVGLKPPARSADQKGQ